MFPVPIDNFLDIEEDEGDEGIGADPNSYDYKELAAAMGAPDGSDADDSDDAAPSGQTL